MKTYSDVLNYIAEHKPNESELIGFIFDVDAVRVTQELCEHKRQNYTKRAQINRWNELNKKSKLII